MYRLNSTILALVFILTLSVVATFPRGLEHAKIKRSNDGHTHVQLDSDHVVPDTVASSSPNNGN